MKSKLSGAHPQRVLQPYIESDRITTEEAAILLNMRGQSINGIKMCYKSTFQNVKLCGLGCQEDDTIDHMFKCEKLNLLKTSSFEAQGFLKPTTQALLLCLEVLEGLQPNCNPLCE